MLEVLAFNFIHKNMASIRSLITSFPSIAFTGSRLSGSQAALSVSTMLPYIASYSGQVAVGCAGGVDTAVRATFTSAIIFKASSYMVRGSITRASFAQRSTAMVNWLARTGGILLAFPSAPAPLGLVVSATFQGHGSGTWGSLALALCLRCPIIIVLPASTRGIFWAHPAIASYFTLLGMAPCGGYIWATAGCFTR